MGTARLPVWTREQSYDSMRRSELVARRTALVLRGALAAKRLARTSRPNAVWQYGLTVRLTELACRLIDEAIARKDKPGGYPVRPQLHSKF